MRTKDTARTAGSRHREPDRQAAAIHFVQGQPTTVALLLLDQLIDLFRQFPIITFQVVLEVQTQAPGIPVAEPRKVQPLSITMSLEWSNGGFESQILQPRSSTCQA